MTRRRVNGSAVNEFNIDTAARYGKLFAVPTIVPAALAGVAAQFQLWYVGGALAVGALASGVFVWRLAAFHADLAWETLQPQVSAPAHTPITIEAPIRTGNSIDWRPRANEASAETWLAAATWLDAHAAQSVSRRNLDGVSGEQYQKLGNDFGRLFGYRKPTESDADWIVQAIMNRPRTYRPAPPTTFTPSDHDRSAVGSRGDHASGQRIVASEGVAGGYVIEQTTYSKLFDAVLIVAGLTLFWLALLLLFDPMGGL